MTLDFRKAAIGLVAAGVIVGVTFGVGVAYGRGDPKTVETGLSAQEIQAMLGLSGGAVAGAPGGVGGGGAGQGGLLGGGTAGIVTEVTAESITVRTAQGEQTFAITASTAVELLAVADSSALQVGATIIVSGSNSEGTLAAGQITELPEALSGLASGGFDLGGAGGRQPGGRQAP